MKREFSESEPEWMDLPSPDSEALEADLRNLERINRHFGGRKAVVRLFERVAAGFREMTLLDLATGFGDHPRALVRRSKELDIRLRVVAVDRQMGTLVLARRSTPAQAPVYFVQADARALPFKDGAVDAAFCSLALHHFSETDARTVLSEMRRLARKAAVCLDLERGRLAAGAVWLLTALWMRNPMTRHDARVSVRRAFSARELEGLAEAAGWGRLTRIRFPWFRQAMVWEKDAK